MTIPWLTAAHVVDQITDVIERRVVRRLQRMEAAVSAVDDKLDALTGAVDGAATELQALRDELAAAGQPGDLSDAQAARFDAIIGSLREATAGPATPEPGPVEPTP